MVGKCEIDRMQRSAPIHTLDRATGADQADILFKEIECVLIRNRNARFLQAVLMRARILEKLMK